MTSPVNSSLTSSPELLLYSRPECHLCEVAAQLLTENGQVFRVKNIEDDLALIRRYGIRIPVLFRPEINAELFWPFNAKDLAGFLELKE